MSTLVLRVFKYNAVAILTLWAAPGMFGQSVERQEVASQRNDISTSDQDDTAASLADPEPQTQQSQPPATDTANASARPAVYNFPDSSQRFRNYLQSAFGVGTIFASGISGAIAQNRNDPPEWKQGAEGYAKRFGSAFGERFIASTTVYGLGEAFHQDTSYHKCACTGTLNRLGHALKETYVARTESGRIVPSLPALVGPYVGGVAGTYAWYPDRFSWKDGIRQGTGILISRPLLSIFREFLP